MKIGLLQPPAIQKPDVESAAKMLSSPIWKVKLWCLAHGKKHKLDVDRKQMFFKPKKVILLDQDTVPTSFSSSQDTEQTINIAVMILHRQVVLLVKIQSGPLILC